MSKFLKVTQLVTGETRIHSEADWSRGPLGRCWQTRREEKGQKKLLRRQVQGPFLEP